MRAYLPDPRYVINQVRAISEKRPMVTVEGTDSSLFLSYKAYQKFPGEELILTKWPDVKTSDDKQHIDNIALTNDFNVESITTIPRLTTDGNSRPVRS